MDLIETKQKRAARERRNKYKPRAETRTTPSNQTRRQAGGFLHNLRERLHWLRCSLALPHAGASPGLPQLDRQAAPGAPNC